MHMVKISETDCSPAIEKVVGLAASQSSHTHILFFRLGWFSWLTASPLCVNPNKNNIPKIKFIFVLHTVFIYWCVSSSFWKRRKQTFLLPLEEGSNVSDGKLSTSQLFFSFLLCLWLATCVNLQETQGSVGPFPPLVSPPAWATQVYIVLLPGP